MNVVLVFPDGADIGTVCRYVEQHIGHVIVNRRDDAGVHGCAPASCDDIARADEVWIVTEKGWSSSKYVRDASRYAIDAGKTVRTIHVDELA